MERTHVIQLEAEGKIIERQRAPEGAVLLEVIRSSAVSDERAQNGRKGPPLTLIQMDAPCNGAGICGKCRVQVIAGSASVTAEDERSFTKRQLEEGYRLACRLKVTGPLTVRIPGAHIQGQKEDIRTPGFSGGGTGRLQPAGNRQDLPECMIAADIGTTTLAAVLLAPDGKVLAEASAVNSQRSYGADVISRMQASNEGKREELKDCIRRDLERLFARLVAQAGGQARVSVKKIAAAANTTMLHLLRGYSCEKLGRYPFEPVSLAAECLDYEQLFTGQQPFAGCQVYLLPGMSAFAGADVTAGLYSSGFWQMPKEETAFFIDLGTNGELACGGSGGFLTASAAAGPAFEGGRLSCGTAGIPGAVSKVSYLYHRVRIQTIGQKKPCGVCGTGALEAVSALRREGLMDENGLLVPQLFETGLELAVREDGTKICLTQADIREIQMAKAAVRAGIEILFQRYAGESGRCGQDKGLVSRVFLAGGFGYYLSADTAAAAGLLPREWKDKVVVCGNTSLKGAAAFLTDPSCPGELEKICGRNQSVRLESSPDFQEIYLNSMRF